MDIGDKLRSSYSSEIDNTSKYANLEVISNFIKIL